MYSVIMTQKRLVLTPYILPFEQDPSKYLEYYLKRNDDS